MPNSNPFLHGTKSSIFAILPKTDHKLLPILRLIEKGIAPPLGTGEIAQGGLRRNDRFGHTCFGRLQTDCGNDGSVITYDLDRIISSYSNRYSSDGLIDNKSLLTGSLTRCKNLNHANMLEILVKLIQLRQTGYDPLKDKGTDKKWKDDTMQAIDLTINYYYFILCLIKYVVVDEQFNRENMQDAQFTLLSMIKKYINRETILEKIKKSNVDFSTIYRSQSLTEKQVDELMCLLKWDEASSEINGIDKEMKISSVFCVQQTEKGVQEGFQVGVELTTGDMDYQCEQVLCSIFNRSYHRPLNDETTIIRTIKRLEMQKNAFGVLLESNQDYFALDAQAKKYADNPFPLVLGVPDAKSELFSCVDSSAQEYHAKKTVHLTLGKEISFIATDTEEHMREVRDYLQVHKIDNVDVVSFEQLRSGSCLPMQASRIDMVNHNTVLNSRLFSQQPEENMPLPSVDPTIRSLHD